MIRRLAPLAAYAVFGLAPMSAAAPLDDIIGFDDPYHCVPSRHFAALLDGLVEFEDSGETYNPILGSLPVPAKLQEWAGTPKLSLDGTEYRATLPLRGTWRGLSLRALVAIGWIESESGFYLVFDSNRAKVLEAANQAGFAIPASGYEYRIEEPAALGVNVGVIDHEGGGALYCIAG